MAIGLCLGLLYASQTNGGLAETLTAYLHTPLPRGGGLWLEALVKHLRAGVVLWLLAFWPPASPLAYAVCAAKTFGAGFAAGHLWQIFGAQGVYHALVLIGLPLLFVLPAMAVLAAANRLYDAKRLVMRRYITTGGLYAAAAVLASVAEAFLLPIAY